jgi:hypothetical protein
MNNTPRPHAYRLACDHAYARVVGTRVAPAREPLHLADALFLRFVTASLSRFVTFANFFHRPNPWPGHRL